MKQRLTIVFLSILLITIGIGVGGVFASFSVNISNVSITSGISGHETQFTNGSTITAKFDTSEEIFSVEDLEIADGLVITFTSTPLDDSSYHHEGSVTVPNDFGTKHETYSDLKVEVTDLSGETGEVDFGHLKYYPDMDIGDYICKSDNKANEKIAIDGSTIVYSFTTNQPVEIVGTSQLLGEEFTYSSSDDRTFVGTYTVTSFTENTELPFPSAKVKDFQGNEYDVTYDDKVVYYISEVISDCKLTTTNSDAQAVIKDDTLTYSFKSNRQLKITGNIKIGGEELKVTEKKNGTFDYTYSCSYKVPENRWEDLGNVSLDVSGAKYSDTCGYENMDLPSVSNTFTFYQTIEKGKNVTDYALMTSNAGKTIEGKTVSKNGDTITMKFKTNRKVNIKSSTINNQNVTFTSTDDLNYETSFVVVDGDDNNEIPVDVVISDPHTGTEISFTKADFDPIVFYAAINFELDSFKSDNAMEKCCINGNKIIANFHTNHPVEVKELKFGNIAMTAESTDKVNWTAELLVNDNFEDLEDIGLTASTSDASGNTKDYKLDDDKRIRYYAPLEKGKNISSGELTTTNAGKTIEGKTVSKVGDTLTISFTSNRILNIPSAKINNKDVEIAAASSIDGSGKVCCTYKIQSELSDGTDDTEIPVNIEFKDTYTGTSVTYTEKDYEPIVFYSAIDIQLDSFGSNNANPALVKNGDTVTVKFHTNHPVNIDSAKIGNYDVVPTANDSKNWTMTLDVNDNFGDLEEFGFSVNVSDNASNPSVELNNGDKKIKYYSPLIASSLNMVSSNDKDGTKYIKDGENIAITLKTNHDVQPTATINGRDVSGIIDINRTILFAGGVGDLSDQQAVHFTIDLRDVAGNTYRTLTEADVANTIIYYAPITGTVNMNASSSKTEGYVRNGDSLTISIATNHATNATSASIQDRDVSITGNKTTYTIPASENYLKEGRLSYYINVDDVAGNTYGTGEETSIIYDRTSPVVQITPEISGFTNQKVEVKASVQDTNIDQNDIKVFLNGEMNTSGGSTGETSYEKNLTLDQEGTFYVEASAVDKAGNSSRAVSGTVIIDKTNPSVTVIDIDINDTPAYQTGFVLAEHFNIKDTYLKNVNCTLTNRTGIGSTKSWDVFAPIRDEGLMTSVISADDMATNISESVRYSFYTDGTAPKIIVKDKATGKVIDEKSTFDSGVDRTYEISLDNIWVGNEKPDHFTTLEVKDSKNNTVKNFITNTDINTAEYKVTDEGEYTLICKAKDDVGNETKEMKFKIKANAEAVTVTPTTKDDVVNTGWIIAGCAAGIGILAVIVVLIVIRKRNKKA